MLLKRKDYVIIGVHGLSNMPPKKCLSNWWRKSIKEGLRKVGFKRRTFHFEMVYWADLMYQHPLNPTIKDPENPQYIDEPYFPESTYNGSNKTWIKRISHWLDDKRVSLFLSKNGLINYEYMFNLVVQKSFKDLDAYYRDLSSNSEGIYDHMRNRIRQRLKHALLKHKKKRILVVGHSMGSIIANDVIHELEGKVKVDVFIAMGSPLGLTLIKKRFFEERHLPWEEDSKYPMAENIHSFHNFSDEDDRIALVSQLHDHFELNSHGIGVQDHLVFNDYKNGPTNNSHKSYGYLRTTEIAMVFHNFINRRPDTGWTKLLKIFRKVAR